ncbi:MAG: hypothetical protein ACPG6B_00545 [Oceanihabitans sp.]
MSNKKHIDRVFQEKLKDFDVSPSPKVWKNIQSKLEQPKEDDKKSAIIWFRVAGIAAILLILLTIGNLIVSNQKEGNNTKIVDTESPKTNQTNSQQINKKQESKNKNITSENKLANSSKTEDKKNTTIVSNSNSKYKNAKTHKPQLSLQNLGVKAKNKNSQKGITNSSNFNNSKKNLSNKSPVNYNNKKTLVAQNTIAKNNKTLDAVKKGQNVTAVKNPANLNAALDTNQADAVLKEEIKSAVAAKTKEEENLEVKEKLTIKTDSLTIEEAIAANQDVLDKTEEENIKRWQVYANIAPVYYNTLGKGSHIDSQFADNSKTGEVNTSYGVNVSYAINKKFKIRSGINALKLSYDTDNVIIYENVNGNSTASLKNIDFNNNQDVSAISATNLGVQQALGILPNENAAISQRIGYYEIPLELEYTISHRRVGINVLAGVSTLILNDNKIYSEYEGRKTHIGEANNINNVSFSGNVGLGIDYKFSKKIKFNVQPTFKYQLNGYKNTSGNFRPYIVGIYTGLSYKF